MPFGYHVYNNAGYTSVRAAELLKALQSVPAASPWHVLLFNAWLLLLPVPVLASLQPIFVLQSAYVVECNCVF